MELLIAVVSFAVALSVVIASGVDSSLMAKKPSVSRLHQKEKDLPIIKEVQEKFLKNRFILDTIPVGRSVYDNNDKKSKKTKPLVDRRSKKTKKNLKKGRQTDAKIKQQRQAKVVKKENSNSTNTSLR